MMMFNTGTKFAKRISGFAVLKYSDESVSSAELKYSISTIAGGSTSIAGIDTDLFSGYLATDGESTSIFTFQNLEAGTYDLYVYSQKDINTSGGLQFTANGVSGSLTNNGTLTSLVEGANYLKTSVVVSDAGTLAISIAKNSQINGIQLLQTSTAPEPASMVLLGIGGVLAAARFRRKNSEASSAAAA